MTSTVMAEFIINMTAASPGSTPAITLQKLYSWVVHENWEEANKIFSRDSGKKTEPLNSMDMTALHVAAQCGNSEFVLKLVNILSPDDLLIRDQQGRTPLHLAAATSKLKAAKAMVAKNQGSVMVEDVYGYTPLFYAARWGNPSKENHNKMVKYLYTQTDDTVYYTTNASNLIAAITASGSYDSVCRILENFPNLALTVGEDGWSLLRILASQPAMLLQENNSSKESIFSWKKKTDTGETQQKRADQEASYIGVVELVCDELQKTSTFQEIMEYFLPSDKPGILQTAIICQVPKLIKVCLKYFPDLLWYSSPFDGTFLLHTAVLYRDKQIFDHIISLTGENMGIYARTIADEENNNILHLAAKMAPLYQLNKLPGPAFQMQRELQWFRKVETLVYKDERLAKNKTKKTPVELLFHEHAKLIKDGTEWMQNAADSGMLIAALVATVAFASMITFPGGIDDKSGLPNFYKRKQFVAFSVANAVSMISSAISLLLFLTIKISKYRVQDFLDKLPWKFLGALLALFVAVATMMLAFGLSVGMAFQTKVNWAYIPITLVACIPAIIFPCLQLPLLLATIQLTYFGSDWSWS